MIIYTLVEEKYTLNGKEYISYGVSGFADTNDESASVIASAHHITHKKNRLAVLVALCNRLKLEPIHLNDVVEDFLSVAE